MEALRAEIGLSPLLSSATVTCTSSARPMYTSRAVPTSASPTRRCRLHNRSRRGAPSLRVRRRRICGGNTEAKQYANSCHARIYARKEFFLPTWQNMATPMPNCWRLLFRLFFFKKSRMSTRYTKLLEMLNMMDL
jgi:hypothetical protein